VSLELNSQGRSFGALCDVFDRLSSQLASGVSSVEVLPFGPVRVRVERYLTSAVPTLGDELPTLALRAESLATRLCVCPRHIRMVTLGGGLDQS